MRNTQNLSIIRSGTCLRRSATRPPGLCRALPWALFRGCWRWVFPSFSMAVIHSSFSLYTWPFFLALMPVAVVVGIALHSLLNGKLLCERQRDHPDRWTDVCAYSSSGCWDNPLLV